MYGSYARRDFTENFELYKRLVLYLEQYLKEGNRDAIGAGKEICVSGW